MSEKKDKKTFNDRDFKKLQLQWYKKLDESGFDDIERTGVNRDKYFDDNTPYLKQQAHSVKNKLLNAPETFKIFSFLRKISWDAQVAPFSAFNSSKTSKKLDKIYCKMLFLYGDGKTLKDISVYLRRYYAQAAPKIRRGRKGQPYSLFWVSTKLQKLLKAIQAGEIYESPNQDEAAKSPKSLKTLKPQEMGGLKKGKKGTTEL